MNYQDKEEKFLELSAQLQRKHPVLVLELRWETVYSIIGCLQLSLRHPGNQGDPAKLVRDFLDTLLAVMDEKVPGLGELLAQRDDPPFDVERN